MESMRTFGSVAYCLLSLGVGIWGLLLATGRARLQSSLTLEFASRNRARLTGILFLIGQTVAVLLMATGRSPLSQGATVFVCLIVPFLVGFAFAKFRPAPEHARGRGEAES